MLIFMLIWAMGAVDDGFGLICAVGARFVLIFGLIYVVGALVAGFVLIFFICAVLVVVSDSGWWLVWFEGGLGSMVFVPLHIKRIVFFFFFFEQIIDFII